MFERFTDRARRVTVMAQDQARLLRHNYVGTEHFLLAHLVEGEGISSKVLQDLGVKYEDARARVIELIGEGPDDQVKHGHLPFTPRQKKVLELSLREALGLGHNYIGTEHLLLGMIREGEGRGVEVLDYLGVDSRMAREATMEFLRAAGSIDLDNRVAEGEFLTPNEHEVLNLTVTLANAIGAAIPEGPNRANDLAELVAHVHPIQHAFMAQAAARTYPKEFRLLGKTIRG